MTEPTRTCQTCSYDVPVRLFDADSKTCTPCRERVRASVAGMLRRHAENETHRKFGRKAQA